MNGKRFERTSSSLILHWDHISKLRWSILLPFVYKKGKRQPKNVTSRWRTTIIPYQWSEVCAQQATIKVTTITKVRCCCRVYRELKKQITYKNIMHRQRKEARVWELIIVNCSHGLYMTLLKCYCFFAFFFIYIRFSRLFLVVYYFFSPSIPIFINHGIIQHRSSSYYRLNSSLMAV